MSTPATGSARRTELLERAYAYTLEHGLADLSLRPLARAAATSPRVLLYLFGSKEQLVREILAKARREQLTLIAELAPAGAADFQLVLGELWRWLAAPRRRPAIRLFFEAYALSLRAEPGPWQGFALQSVTDWTAILVAAQPGVAPELAEARATRTLALLRGLLLHLLTGAANPDHLLALLLADPQ